MLSRNGIPQEILDLVIFLAGFLEKHFQWNCIDSGIALWEYRDTHGNAALKAIAGYVKWARENEKVEDEIIMTIAHDVGGRNDKLMLPRTFSYLEFYEEGWRCEW